MVLSCFVGGAPLICAPQHCDLHEWVTTNVTFLFFPLSHHVSRADSKICTYMLPILSAMYNMETAKNYLHKFFCLWNWCNPQFYFFSRVSLLHLLEVNVIVIKTLRLTFRRQCHRLQFLIIHREEVMRLLHRKTLCCMMRPRRLPWVSRCHHLFMFLHMLNISAAYDLLFCIAWQPVLDTLPANDLGIVRGLPPLLLSLSILVVRSCDLAIYSDTSPCHLGILSLFSSLEMAMVQARVPAGGHTQTMVPVTGDGFLIWSPVTLSCICWGVCLNPTPSSPLTLWIVPIEFVC